MARRFHPYIKRPRAAVDQPWTLPELCAAYDWPRNQAGVGTIAIVELGGGWVQSDVTSFFTSVGLPAPQITDVSVDATSGNRPGVSDADGEVALDIQVAGASFAYATGRPAVIRMYWSTDIASAVRAAIADGCRVCSISWGADEANWGQVMAGDMEMAAIEAYKAGMLIFAAAGDNDSSDGGPTPANVDLPGTAPFVISCGGTSKPRNAPETVWNNNPGNADGEGTGGGYSTFWPMPTWQLHAPKGKGWPANWGRMVPDVAANADPGTGYEIMLQGQSTVVGGTSAVAPLYAGLFASFPNVENFVTAWLYKNPGCFTDITTGGNGTYDAGPGPDPCTGLGAPIGAKLAALYQPAPGAPTAAAAA